MAEKTYTYDELSDEAKAHAREWRETEDADYLARELDTTLTKTLETAGLELVTWGIDWGQRNYVTVEPDYLRWDDMLRWLECHWEEPYPHFVCPRMEFRGDYVIGDDAAYFWNETCAPVIDKVLAKIEGLRGDELYDAFDVDEKVMEQITVFENELLRMLKSDLWACYEDDNVLSNLRSGGTRFDEYGNPK